jgi:hypothetical protein
MDETAYQLCDGFAVNTGYFSVQTKIKQMYLVTNATVMLSDKVIYALDLFDNPVGYLTVLQFFRLRACELKVRQNCVF